MVLDPRCDAGKLRMALEQKKDWQRLIKRGLHTLTKHHYQILYCDGMMTAAEKLESKVQVTNRMRMRSPPS